MEFINCSMNDWATCAAIKGWANRIKWPSLVNQSTINRKKSIDISLNIVWGTGKGYKRPREGWIIIRFHISLVGKWYKTEQTWGHLNCSPSNRTFVSISLMSTYSLCKTIPATFYPRIIIIALTVIVVTSARAWFMIEISFMIGEIDSAITVTLLKFEQSRHVCCIIGRNLDSFWNFTKVFNQRMIMISCWSNRLS